MTKTKRRGRRRRFSSSSHQFEQLERRVVFSASPGDNRFFGAITMPGQHQTYDFSLPNSTPVWFDSQTNDGNLRWDMKGPTGSVSSAWFSYDDQYLGTLQPGDYSVTVSGNADYTGSYLFRVLEMSSAAAATLTPGTPVSGTLDPANSTNLYKFSGTAGDAFYFDNTAFSTTDGYDYIGYYSWTLYDQYGTQVFSQDLSDAGRVTLPNTGDYTLVVSSYVWLTGTTDYSFNVLPVSDDTAALTLGTAVASSIASEGQQDAYSFTLPAAARLRFDSQTDDGNLRWDLVGPTGNVTASWFSYDDQDIGLLPAGDYTLTVSGYSDHTGDYVFKLLDLASATAFTAGTAGTPTGSAQTEILDPANETDLYRFTGTAGDSLKFDNVFVAVGTNANWELIDPYGTVVFNDYIGSDQTPGPLTASGTYTLVLYGAVGETNTTDYRFRVNYLSHTNPVAITGADLALGTLQNDTAHPIDSSGEVDFKFTLATPKRLWFDSQTNDNSLGWQLTGPTGSVAAAQFDYDDQNLGLLPQGTYSLKVFGPEGGAYAFRLLDFAAATTLTPGTPVSDTLDPANSTNLYKFSGTAGDTFYFDNTAFSTTDGYDSTGYYSWTLYDQYGTQVFSQGLSDAGRVTLPNTGEYTLVVSSYVWLTGTTDYTFNVVPVTDNTATLTLGTVVSGNIDGLGRHDTYTFTLPAAARLRFDSQTDDGNLRWDLVGPTGNVMGSWFNYDDQDIGLLPAGDYTLTVSGYVDYTGSYAFQLLNFAAATPFTPGTPVSDTLDPANSTNLYKFSGTAGDTFYFDNTAFSTTDGYDYTGYYSWTLYDQYGTQVFSQGLSDAGRVTLPNTGTYTLVVSSYVWLTGTTDYTFNVRSVIDDVMTLWGTGGDDVVKIQYLSSTSEDVYLNNYLMGTLSGGKSLTYDGKGGMDSALVIGTSADDTFAISPTTAGLATANVTFMGVANRVVDGSGGADSFNYSGANPDLSLLGGTGVDIFKPGDGATVPNLDGGADGATIDYTESSVGVVLDVAAGNVTGVTQITSITGVVGSPQSDAPIGIAKTVTAFEDTDYVFAATDFEFADPGDSPANTLLAVKVVTLPSIGSLMNNGVAVTAGDVISVDDINSGRLKFVPAANENGANYASFTFQVQDNGGTDNAGLDTDPTARTFTLNVAAVDDAPVIADFAHTVSYTENGAALGILSSSTTVADIDSADFEGGNLTVVTTARGSIYDVVSIANQGTGSGQIGVSGSTVLYQGVAIGSFIGGLDGKSLTVAFDSPSATPTAVQALLRAITFRNVSDNPYTSTRTIRFLLTDGDGGTSDPVFQNIAMVAVNDAPNIANYANTGVYTENDPPLPILSAGTTVADPDSTNFSGGKLTVVTTAHGSVYDVVSIANQGTGPSQIGLSGTTVLYGGVAIGSFSGGVNGAPLGIYFAGSAATPAAIQALLRAITFYNVSETPYTLTRTIRFTLTDGDGGTSNLAFQDIAVVAVNDAPVIGNFAADTSYFTNDPPVPILSAGTTVNDPDSANFSGGKLTVKTIANGSIHDRVSITNQGTGAGQIGLSGSTVLYEGVAIGVFGGGTNGTPLGVYFSGPAATPGAAQALIRAITFQNVGEHPYSRTRTLRFTLTDGDGGTSNLADQDIAVFDVTSG